GQVSGNKGISNFWMVKVNNSGTLLWQQCFGGSKVDEPTSVLSTPDGGSIVIGNASSNDGDISGNHGGGDIWVLKLSPGFLLPLRLLSFNCYRENNFVITQWQTANEDHVKNFVVERSYAGLTFDSIGSLPAKGNLQSINNYQFTDVSPFATNGNVIYYRLKTTDIDGRYSLSNIVAVRLENHSIISVNPNPAHNVLSINIESGKQEKIELYICDVEGQILQRKPLDLFKGNNFINLDVSSLSRGSYFLMFNTDSHNSYKWIKE
ncbi:MAG TPA: T9SS type A sorting domain-containing protein, partial [Hanamia sp.]|nr:T9SS type A sorting domain-containing protein [Hanamia sp.]